jgi:uncharacterized protein
MAFPVKDKWLLLHGLSGAVKLVDKETAQKFFDGNVTEELKPFFTYLTPEKEYEKATALCTFLMKKATASGDGTLAVTYDCNLRCPYCYEIWAKHPETMKMVIDTYKVDKAYEALEFLNKDCSKKSLTITGGEPFMKKNTKIIQYILKKGTDLGYTFTVFSNGVELTHFLPLLSSVTLHYIQITLDGPRLIHDSRRVLRKGKGTFDLIVKNIDEARAVGIPLLIRTTTDPEILSRIDELADFYKEKGWITDPYIRFLLSYRCHQHITPKSINQTIELYNKVLNCSKRQDLNFFEVYPYLKLRSVKDSSQFWPSFWNCNAVSSRYVFDPFGDVYPCRAMLGWKEQCIGTYIPALSFNEKHEQWRNRTIFSINTCTECDVALVCGGSCGYASLVNDKDLFSPVCAPIKKLVAQYVEYLYERGDLDRFTS